MTKPNIDEVFSVCVKFLTKEAPVPNQMLALRTLVNLFNVKEVGILSSCSISNRLDLCFFQGEKLLRTYRNTVVTRVFEQLFPIADENKNVQVNGFIRIYNNHPNEPPLN